MNVATILKPNELPFPVTKDVRDRINDLISAYERDDCDYIDCYLDELEGSARDLPEEQDRWIRAYYVDGGWANA